MRKDGDGSYTSVGVVHCRWSRCSGVDVEDVVGVHKAELLLQRLRRVPVAFRTPAALPRTWSSSFWAFQRLNWSVVVELGLTKSVGTPRGLPFPFISAVGPGPSPFRLRFASRSRQKRTSCWWRREKRDLLFFWRFCWTRSTLKYPTFSPLTEGQQFILYLTKLT